MQQEKNQKIWNSKKVLRVIYQDFYSIINNQCIDGNILEIGGGMGNFNIEGRTIIKTDVEHSNAINFVSDAHSLPFQDSKFKNIVLIDVLHHLDCPINFLKEASRVLTPNGRLIMIEPGITPVSWLLYKFGHEEDVDMKWSPKKNCIPNPKKNPYDSNQAIPTLIFNKYNSILDSLNFSLIFKKWLSLFAYPMSGGFKKWTLIPSSLASLLLKIENKLLPLLGPVMAFRMIVVLENKKST
jgi:SAM-dependent methyltransferase